MHTPRIQSEDELELYVRLQELPFSKLEDVDFHRSLDEMDLDTYADGPRRRIQQMLGRLGRAIEHTLNRPTFPPGTCRCLVAEPDLPITGRGQVAMSVLPRALCRYGSFLKAMALPAPSRTQKTALVITVATMNE